MDYVQARQWENATVNKVLAWMDQNRGTNESAARYFLENFQEIVNILAQLLNSPKTSHLRLSGVHVIPGDLPDGVSSLLAQPQFRRDFAVQIDGYGSGRISLLVN